MFTLKLQCSSMNASYDLSLFSFSCLDVFLFFVYKQFFLKLIIPIRICKHTSIVEELQFLWSGKTNSFAFASRNKRILNNYLFRWHIYLQSYFTCKHCTMADSPTRRSSIPILKQKSYGNLNLCDDQSQLRKNRSPSSVSSMSPPILDNPKMPPKLETRTSNLNLLPKLEINNDLVITKLCDENKRLKEHQTQLMSKYEEGELIILMARIYNNNHIIFSCSRK